MNDLHAETHQYLQVIPQQACSLALTASIINKQVSPCCQPMGALIIAHAAKQLPAAEVARPAVIGTATLLLLPLLLLGLLISGVGGPVALPLGLCCLQRLLQLTRRLQKQMTIDSQNNAALLQVPYAAMSRVCMLVSFAVTACRLTVADSDRHLKQKLVQRYSRGTRK